MYTLVADTSVDGYIDDLEQLPDHHVCRIKNTDASVSVIAYRDSRNGLDRLFFDNVAGNDQSDIFVSRYDDLDCVRYDDGTIMQM